MVLIGHRLFVLAFLLSVAVPCTIQQQLGFTPAASGFQRRIRKGSLLLVKTKISNNWFRFENAVPFTHLDFCKALQIKFVTIEISTGTYPCREGPSKSRNSCSEKENYETGRRHPTKAGFFRSGSMPPVIKDEKRRHWQHKDGGHC